MTAAGADPHDQSGNPLWRFSLNRYNRAGVAALCLRLQDDHQADVNLVLAAFWLALEGHAFSSPAAPDRLAGVVCARQEKIVTPLRRVRRDLKTWPDLSEADRSDLRKGVQSRELEAERLEQDMLYRYVTTNSDSLLQPAREGVAEIELAAQGRERDTLMIDATHLKAHRTAASLQGKKGGTVASSGAARAG